MKSLRPAIPESQEPVHRCLPCIDYGGSLVAFTDTFYQTQILGPRKV